MSRKITTVAIATVVAVSFLFVGAGAVAAHDGGNDVGTSGNCDDGENGGGGSMGVTYNGDVDATDANELQDTLEGFQHYGEQNEGGDDPCDNHNSDYDSYDYLEVHAYGPNGENGVQYCFSENNSGDNGNLRADGGDACGHN